MDLKDKIVAILSYSTFGFFAVIWIIYAHVKQNPIQKALMFNLFQSIFISVILAILSYVYSISIDLLSMIPVINGVVRVFNIFFNGTPMFLSCTFSGLLVTMLLTYLNVMVILNKKPYIPYCSDIVGSNF